MRYRIQGRIRDSHAILYNYNDFQKSHLFDTFTETYNYEKLIEDRVKIQQSRFKGKDIITKKTTNIAFNESTPPFILKQNVLKINAPGHAYSICKPLLPTNINYFDYLTKPTLALDDPSVIDLRFLLHAHEIIDRDGCEETGKPKMTYTKEELIKLVDRVLVAHLDVIGRYSKQRERLKRIERDIATVEKYPETIQFGKNTSFEVESLETAKKWKEKRDEFLGKYRRIENEIKELKLDQKELNDEKEKLEHDIEAHRVGSNSIYEGKQTLDEMHEDLAEIQVFLKELEEKITTREKESQENFRNYSVYDERVQSLKKYNSEDLMDLLEYKKNGILMNLSQITNEILEGAKPYLNKIKYENLYALDIYRKNFENIKLKNK